jgi:hypothetical protein
VGEESRRGIMSRAQFALTRSQASKCKLLARAV